MESASADAASRVQEERSTLSTDTHADVLLQAQREQEKLFKIWTC